jgi:predicted TIM-barrel fold metal-dependent hydrolase
MSSAPSKLLGIDSHFHIFPAGQARADARYVPAYEASFESWQSAAAAIGVTKGVVVQPSFLGTDNSRLCAELRAHPDDLRGIAVVDPACNMETLRELAVCGVRGVRLNLSGASHELSAWRGASALWDEMFRLGWHVELLTDVGALPQVLTQLPQELPIVVDHMGRPAAVSNSDPTFAVLKARARKSSVHVKLSGAYRLQGLDAKTVAQALLDSLGSASLLWGSDWPCTNYEKFANYSRLHGALSEWVDEDAAAMALRVNPEALYWPDASTSITSSPPQP